MPTLGEKKQKKIILPSSVPGDEAWVIVDTNITMEIVYAIENLEGKQADFEAFKRLIVDWNFTDKDKKKLEINAANIEKMNIFDIKAIKKELGIETAQKQPGLTDLKKKD